VTSLPAGINRERSFGLSVGAVLCAVAIYLAWRGRMTPAGVVGAVGGLLVILGYLAPPLLKYPSDAWWKLAMVLGWVNSRVLLSLVFFILLTPIGVIWRLTGKDPLSRRRESWQGWLPHPERYRNPRHFDRMF
jgi:hypothetical protein